MKIEDDLEKRFNELKKIKGDYVKADEPIVIRMIVKTKKIRIAKK